MGERLPPLIAVSFDLIYQTDDHDYCIRFPGMDNNQIPLVRVKIEGAGWWSGFLICLQIVTQLAVLIYVTLNYINTKRPSGSSK
ncbi:ORF2 [Seal anellovirus 3]|uniref:ORF2 n=1 Tax=Seal anellovirus 3 TaxID=1427156 RepID=V5NGP8_9VIRU|nr:ORF2 [Seal anellovirus 3]AHA86832.1 ORF2 [Seal anellovirus 3]